jgi:hypothetical protein
MQTSLNIDTIALIRIVAFILVIVIVFFAYLFKRKKADVSPGLSQAWNVPIASQLRSVGKQHVDAMITILQSDDETIVNKPLYILHFPVSIGRHPDNDIALPKDTPVSRFHIRLDQDKERILLSEVVAMERQEVIRPTYGTFVNGVKVEGQVEIKPNDQICLGKRFCFRFEPVVQLYGGLIPTKDIKSPDPEEETVIHEK